MGVNAKWEASKVEELKKEFETSATALEKFFKTLEGFEVVPTLDFKSYTKLKVRLRLSS
jgi:hypothetical protein